MKWVRWMKILLFVQAGVNLVGALGPELSFDALWYHLPLSRLLLERGWWGVVPGGLLYYSGMPRLIEWVNAGLLYLGSTVGMESPEVLPKLASWGAGLGAALMIVRLGRKYWGEKAGWIAGVLWYTTILVGWQSMVVYVDLARTLLVLTAVWWWGEKRWGWAGVAMGLAYSVKMISGGEALIVVTVMGLQRRSWGEMGRFLLGFLPFVAFWGGLNLAQGHVFFYPFGELPILNESHVGLSWRHIVGPLTGDGRYVLPEYALFLVVITGKIIRGERKKWRERIVVGMALTQAFLGITYRTAANLKFVPYLIGKETKREFLSTYLNFDFGDWADVDGWVGENLVGERYLVRGVHNTYYLPGSKWELESWLFTEECFPYVLVQGESQQEGEVIHEVEKTGTRIYKVECM